MIPPTGYIPDTAANWCPDCPSVGKCHMCGSEHGLESLQVEAAK